MKTMTSIATLMAITLAGARAASAQAPVDSSAFININVGAQTQSRTVNTTTSFPLYGETATVAAAMLVDKGPIFDASGGFHLTKNFAVGVGVSAFSRTGEGAIAASIPSPVVFARPIARTVTESGLKHTEIGAHIMALVFIPVTDNFDVAVFGGPSFIRVKHDVPTVSVPAGTQNANVATESQNGTAKGANAGVEANVLFARHWGVGFFVRFAGGSVDLPAVSDLKVGGVQAGGGLRLRF